ncbi:MAG: hypothetical protein AAF203_09270, partial [Pseudomonadota bacterium]
PFNPNRGDSVTFIEGGGLSLDLRTSKVSIQKFYNMMESTIYESRGTTFSPFDLPASYCDQSALPHCQHINSVTCQGTDCPPISAPVRCHWQKRMSSADVNNAYGGLSNIGILTRDVTPQDPMIADCNTPGLLFDINGDPLAVSMADYSCVPDKSYYVSQGGDFLAAVFTTELNRVANLGVACNSYSNYSWLSTKWTYASTGGFTIQLNQSFRNVSYEVIDDVVNGQPVQRGIVDLRWKDAGDLQVYCADDVFFNEYDALFPEDGLQYEIFRPQAVIADVPTARITYEDPSDGGQVWTFFLDRGSAMSNAGGPILSEADANTVRNTVELLINRAKTLELGSACN